MNDTKRQRYIFPDPIPIIDRRRFWKVKPTSSNSQTTSNTSLAHSCLCWPAPVRPPPSLALDFLDRLCSWIGIASELHVILSNDLPSQNKDAIYSLGTRLGSCCWPGAGVAYTHETGAAEQEGLAASSGSVREWCVWQSLFFFDAYSDILLLQLSGRARPGSTSAASTTNRVVPRTRRTPWRTQPSVNEMWRPSGSWASTRSGSTSRTTRPTTTHA